MNQESLPARRPALSLTGTSGPRKPANTQPTDELVQILLQEARRHKLALAIIFASIALVTLLAGLFLLRQNYSSSTTILAQESDIIQPLLEGRAVATNVSDRAGIARQVIFSRKVLEGALERGGWTQEDLSALKKEKLLENLKENTTVTSPRQDLVQITYRDSDPERTFRVTEHMGELFIQESLATKERESREAFEFIDSQVRDYHQKLTDAEQNLQRYRSANADAQPGSAADVNTRISELRTQVEQARMNLLEQRSRENSLVQQLSGESAVTAVQTRESLYRAQMLELQTQLDTLLLNYTEEHPDVRRLRHQMSDIQRSLEQEQQRRAQASQNRSGNGAFDDAQFNPLYQELRSRLAEVRREAAATESRMQITQNMLNEELDRGRRIATSESTLAELTRDYEVNRDIYQDLLRRRENARVSMALDQEKRGLTMRVQDPATRPLRPSGLRFMHFALGGLALALIVPLGLLALRVRFDPRMRSARQMERQLNGTVLLATIPSYPSPKLKHKRFFVNMASASCVALVVIAYALVYGIKQMNS